MQLFATFQLSIWLYCIK